jgi:hypothetical protein
MNVDDFLVEQKVFKCKYCYELFDNKEKVSSHKCDHIKELAFFEKLKKKYHTPNITLSEIRCINCDNILYKHERIRTDYYEMRVDGLKVVTDRKIYTAFDMAFCKKCYDIFMRKWLLGQYLLNENKEIPRYVKY